MRILEKKTSCMVVSLTPVVFVVLPSVGSYGWLIRLPVEFRPCVCPAGGRYLDSIESNGFYVDFYEMKVQASEHSVPDTPTPVSMNVCVYAM